MAIENKEEFLSQVISRVINNAPVSEVLRVYSLSVKAAIADLSEEDLIESVLKAGYTDLLEEFVNPEDFIREE
jgi:hypothetical protein